jgi:protein-S-isoprenylcysteine O-methyltransferase Ste14
MAVAAWVAYLCVHFGFVPGWFAWRYQRSPYALRWLPRNGYDLGESAYGLLVAGYTVAVLIGPLPEPRWPLLALVCVIAGSGLILWAVATLGGSWRIGQDDNDTTCVYATRGPYRLLRHPIYVGMALSAFGQMLLTAADLRGLTLFLGTVAYGLLQGRAESRRWASRQRDRSGLLAEPAAAPGRGSMYRLTGSMFTIPCRRELRAATSGDRYLRR